MANLTNSAKLIEEMEKKAYTSDLWAAALSNQYSDLDWKPTIPTVNNSTIKIQKNSTDVDSFTTNAAEGKTINITVTASDVGLWNVDNTSDLNKPVSTATQTALNLKANSADVYTSAQTDSAISSAIDTALSSVFVYKGSKASYDQLPSSWNKKWDVWNVEAAHTTDPKFDAGTNVAWNGTGWDPLAGTIDLSAYATTTYVDWKISDTAYWSWWDGDDSHAPSKNAVYDKLNAMDTTIAGKQAALDTQTAYSAKGSATKVPQITTNTLGQVTGITEVTITQPDISWKADKTEVLTKTNTTSFTPTWDYHPATKKYVDDVAAGINSAEWWNITGTLSNQTDLQSVLDAKVWSSNNTIHNVVHLSQADYDALTTKDPNTWYSTPDNESGGFDPENTWSTGQLLTRTATGYDWETVTGVPSGWSTWQVLTKTSNWPAWSTIPSQVSNTAFWSSWDWDTTTAPSKNAIYDVLWDVESLLAAI